MIGTKIMEINYVIIGSNTNPLYYDFWPIISKVWKNNFNITPVLGLICEENSDFINTEYGLIKKFKCIDNIDSGLQSQIIRLYLPKLLNGNCLISDIDMLPLSKKYFIDIPKSFTDDDFILFSADNPECISSQQFPMCYVLGNSEKYKEIFDLNLDWEDFANLLNSLNFGWFTDQRYLYEKVLEKAYTCKFLERGWSGQAVRRIDRINWTYDENLLKNDYYIDSHLLRPYDAYKKEIDKLINLIT